MRRWRWWLFGGAAAVLVAGCSSAGPERRPSSVFAASELASVRQELTPPSAAVADAIDACMAAAGFGAYRHPRPDPDDPTIAPAEFGVLPVHVDLRKIIEERALRRYRTMPGLEGTTGAPLSDEQAQLWGLGDGPGCEAAADALWAPLIEFERVTAPLLAAVDRELAADPDAVAAVEAWRLCLREAGFAFGSITEIEDELRVRTNVVTSGLQFPHPYGSLADDNPFDPPQARHEAWLDSLDWERLERQMGEVLDFEAALAEASRECGHEPGLIAPSVVMDLRLPRENAIAEQLTEKIDQLRSELAALVAAG